MSERPRRSGEGRDADVERAAHAGPAEQESVDGEAEPPERRARDGDAGDPVAVSWSQPQGNYPAPERPLDLAEAQAAARRRPRLSIEAGDESPAEKRKSA